MKIQAIKWGKLLAFIASGGLTAGFAATGDPHLIAAGVILAALAGAATQLVPNPATSVAQDAPVVNQSGQTVGLNVSTTSTAPISAPQKGTP